MTCFQAIGLVVGRCMAFWEPCCWSPLALALRSSFWLMPPWNSSALMCGFCILQLALSLPNCSLIWLCHVRCAVVVAVCCKATYGWWRPHHGTTFIFWPSLFALVSLSDFFVPSIPWNPFSWSLAWLLSSLSPWPFMQWRHKPISPVVVPTSWFSSWDSSCCFWCTPSFRAVVSLS